MAQFRIFSPNPSPCLALSNAPPRHRHYFTRHTQTPPPINARRLFHRRTRNRAPGARFRTFSRKPAAPACASKRSALPPPLHCRRHLTTSPHCYPLPFATARLKSNPGGSVFGFVSQNPAPRARYRTDGSTDAATSIPTSHQPPPLPALSISTCAPGTEPPALSFGLSAPNLNPRARYRTGATTTTTTSSAVPHAPPPSPPPSIFNSAPGTKSPPLSFWLLGIFFSSSPYYC
jgi:hypothetical protein